MYECIPSVLRQYVPIRERKTSLCINYRQHRLRSHRNHSTPPHPRSRRRHSCLNADNARMVMPKRRWSSVLYNLSRCLPPSRISHKTGQSVGAEFRLVCWCVCLCSATATALTAAASRRVSPKLGQHYREACAACSRLHALLLRVYLFSV